MPNPIILPVGHSAGVNYNLANQAYHLDPAFSSSQIALAVEKSLRHLQRKHPYLARKMAEAYGIELEDEDPTDAMRFGTAMHCYLLEREEFDKRFLILPEDCNLRTNAGKAIKADYQALAEERGGLVLKASEKAEIEDMARALGEHELDLGGKTWKMKDLFRYGRPEVSFFWKDPISGLPLRCRCDWIIEHPQFKLIIDYKTTRSAKRSTFQKDAGGKYYWLRQAMYVDGVRIVRGQRYDYIIVAQEKDGPKLSMAYTYESHEESIGRELYRDTLLDIRKSLESGYFPGYRNARMLQRLDVPSWIIQEHPEMDALARGEVPPQHIAEGE